MELNELYKIYGELMVQAEILQNRTMDIKRQIAEQLNKPRIDNAPTVEARDEK
jgi:hypothetical protein